MVWARLDDAILDNPKIAKVGVLGFALHVAAITWSCRNERDGFVPAGQTRLLLDIRGLTDEFVSLVDRSPRTVPAATNGILSALENAGEPSVEPLIADLVDAGLWKEVDGGYEIHDFLVYNPSRAELAAKRQRETERKGKYRESHRPSHGVSRRLSQRDSQRDSASRPAVIPPLPDPGPLKTKTAAVVAKTSAASLPAEAPSSVRPISQTDLHKTGQPRSNGALGPVPADELSPEERESRRQAQLAALEVEFKSGRLQ